MSETVYLDVIYNLAGDITNIRNRIPGFTGSCSKYTPILKTNTNIISILKQFRVQRDEFSTLSDILSNIQSMPNDTQRTSYQLTDRQGTFTNKYLITGLGSLIQITNPITINISPGSLTFTINIIPLTKLSYIRHELINPLHTIKLSSTLMKNQPTDIDKLGDLIASKVDESLSVLDGLLAISYSPQLDPINTHAFISYINGYITTINQSYSQTITPNIIWTQPTKLNYNTHSSGIVYINTCYIKVILDNIFKNIFGHLDNRVSDREFNDFTVKIDSPNTNSDIPTYMHIIIRNRILNRMSGSTDTTPFVFSKLSSTNKLQGIYHLDTSSHTMVAVNSEPVCKTKNPVRGTGIQLIDELCKKMNIQWQIEELDDDYTSRGPTISFTLKIPISHSLNRKNRQVWVPVPYGVSIP